MWDWLRRRSTGLLFLRLSIRVGILGRFQRAPRARPFGFSVFAQFWGATQDLTCVSCRACNSATNGASIDFLAAHTADNEFSQVC